VDSKYYYRLKFQVDGKDFGYAITEKPGFVPGLIVKQLSGKLVGLETASIRISKHKWPAEFANDLSLDSLLSGNLHH